MYRNINKLVETGDIRKLSINNELDHYDGDLTNHYHFICTSCNKIIDIFDIDVDLPSKKITNKYNVNIEKSDIILYGICDECQKTIKS